MICLHLQAAEKEGFDTDEAEFAVRMCLGDQLLPLQWLRQVWVSRVQAVRSKVTKEGKDMSENEVGDLSDTEAKTALKESSGEIQQAVDICTKRRRKLVRVTKCNVDSVNW